MGIYKGLFQACLVKPFCYKAISLSLATNLTMSTAQNPPKRQFRWKLDRLDFAEELGGPLGAAILRWDAPTDGRPIFDPAVIFNRLGITPHDLRRFDDMTSEEISEELYGPLVSKPLYPVAGASCEAPPPPPPLENPQTTLSVAMAGLALESSPREVAGEAFVDLRTPVYVNPVTPVYMNLVTPSVSVSVAPPLSNPVVQRYYLTGSPVYPSSSPCGVGRSRKRSDEEFDEPPPKLARCNATVYENI